MISAVIYYFSGVFSFVYALLFYCILRQFYYFTVLINFLYHFNVAISHVNM